MKIAFNTGRFYNEVGQPITAEVVGDVIVFVDHARGIDGEIPLAKFSRSFDSPSHLARHVLYMYDQGQYQHVSVGEGPVYASLVAQHQGYDEWVTAHNLSPDPMFMLS